MKPGFWKPRSRARFQCHFDMVDRTVATFFLVVSFLLVALDASAGDADPLYRECVGECHRTGCIGENCFTNCKFSLESSSHNRHWYMKEPLYLKWKQWDCLGDCRYHCMINREKERALLDQGPVKYRGKWPFKPLLVFQEPASVAFSALNLAMHFHGWLSFVMLIYYKLPLKLHKKPCYDFTALCHIYGLLSMNSMFWSVVFHSRDTELTERLDYSSAIALIGFSLLMVILRSFNLKEEASRVIVAAPLLAFVTTHILYLNNYKRDYGWNMKVCSVMVIAQHIVWAVWVGVTRHPSRWKLWTVVVVGGGLALLLEMFDFPPYQGMVDAHALWHAATIPLTFLWWSFIMDDAEFRTYTLVKKAN